MITNLNEDKTGGKSPINLQKLMPQIDAISSRINSKFFKPARKVEGTLVINFNVGPSYEDGFLDLGFLDGRYDIDIQLAKPEDYEDYSDGFTYFQNVSFPANDEQTLLVRIEKELRKVYSFWEKSSRKEIQNLESSIAKIKKILTEIHRLNSVELNELARVLSENDLGRTLTEAPLVTEFSKDKNEKEVLYGNAVNIVTLAINKMKQEYRMDVEEDRKVIHVVGENPEHWVEVYVFSNRSGGVNYHVFSAGKYEMVIDTDKDAELLKVVTNLLTRWE